MVQIIITIRITRITNIGISETIYTKHTFRGSAQLFSLAFGTDENAVRLNLATDGIVVLLNSATEATAAEDLAVKSAAASSFRTDADRFND